MLNERREKERKIAATLSTITEEMKMLERSEVTIYDHSYRLTKQMM